MLMFIRQRYEFKDPTDGHHLGGTPVQC